jgi:acetyl-CoA carboxylase biotin carboxyl carrier protein
MMNDEWKTDSAFVIRYFEENVVAVDDISPASGSEPGPFDVPTIRQLIAMMGRHDLNEIDLQDGVKRIRLRRGLRTVMTTPQVFAAPTVVAPSVDVKPVETKSAETTAKPSRPTVAVKSPGVGTFYVASKPGAPPFVQVGTRVNPTMTVGILEAMKIMNEIPAECSGVVVEVLVQNQQPVEHNQVLFLVDPVG